MEIWKQYKDSNYEVSNMGNVRNLKTKRSIKPQMITGYQRVGVYKLGKRKQIMVHRMVADCFIPTEDESKPFIDHINRNRVDNRVENLRWVSAKENVENRVITKVSKKVISDIIRLHNEGLSEDDIWNQLNNLLFEF